jgi:hypothetical protein
MLTTLSKFYPQTSTLRIDQPHQVATTARYNLSGDAESRTDERKDLPS